MAFYRWISFCNPYSVMVNLCNFVNWKYSVLFTCVFLMFLCVKILESSKRIRNIEKLEHFSSD